MKIFSFNGRSHRLAYLGIHAAVLVALVVPVLVTLFVSGRMISASSDNLPPYGEAVLSVGMIIVLLLAIPATWISLAVTVRRMHDLGWTGWWCLVSVQPLIPLIGLIQGIWLLVVPSQQGENRFGPSLVEVTQNVAETFA